MTSHIDSRFLGYYAPSSQTEVLKQAEEHARNMVMEEGLGKK
ncbi:MAG: hypothetical protein P9L88_02785 [Candidatus Tantalella remota]|nr:hypothetical protein [Candidatus Tantalella remota]